MPKRAPLHSTIRSPSNPLFQRTQSSPESPIKGGKAYIVYHSSRWNRLRANKIASNPICENCIIDGKTTASKYVHHKTKIQENPDLAFVWENLISLCDDCHRKLELTGKRIFIYGPPGAGKTTYALSVMGERDLIIDIDRIVEAIGIGERVDRHYLLGFGIVLKNALLDYVGECGHTHNVYVITTMNSDKAIESAGVLRAEPMLINPGVPTCIERIKKRGREVDRLCMVASNWK